MATLPAPAAVRYPALMGWDSDEDQTSARQRIFAIAWGIPFNAKTSREALSREIDRAMEEQGTPANKTQLRLAKQCGIEVQKGATRNDLKDRLWEFQCAVAYVLSVLRHSLGARWKRYYDANVDDGDIYPIAHELIASGLWRDSSLEHTDSLNADMWYRITKKAAEQGSYRFVLEKAESRMAAVLAKRRNKPKREASQNAGAPARKGGGCVLVLVAAFLATIAACA